MRVIVALFAALGMVLLNLITWWERCAAPGDEDEAD